MMTNTFKPPRYTEQTFAIFDRKSGQVLATETHWVLQDSRPGRARVGGKEILSASPALVESIARGQGRAAKDLDVLPLTKSKGTTMTLSHIDITRRRPVYAKLDKTAGQTPARIAEP